MQVQSIQRDVLTQAAICPPRKKTMKTKKSVLVKKKYSFCVDTLEHIDGIKTRTSNWKRVQPACHRDWEQDAKSVRKKHKDSFF